MRNTDDIVNNINNVEGLASANSVDGFILPNGGVSIYNGATNTLIPIGGNNSAGTVNQDSNILFTVSANQPNCSIFVNGENTFRTTPNKVSFRLSEVVRDGTKTITLKKEGFSTDESYVIHTINNPNFNQSALTGYQNTTFNQDGVFGIVPNKQIYTNISPYSFKIDYYKNGVLQSYDGTFDSNEIKSLEFKMEVSSVKNIETKSGTYNLTINLDGPDNSVIANKIGSNDFVKLVKGINLIVSDAGSKYSISSTNLNLYKINKIQATSEGFKPKTLQPENAESLATEISLDTNYVVDITSEQFSSVLNPKPVIDVINKEARKYNIHSKIDYPIALAKNGGPLTKITAYIGTKTHTFSNLNIEDTNSTVVLIPADTFDKIGNYKIVLVPSNTDGDGDILEIPLSVVDEIYVGVPDLRNISYPTDMTGPDYVGYNVDFDISYESVNTDYIRIHINDSLGYIQEKADGKVTLNFQNLLNVGNINLENDANVHSITLKLVPHNISGFEVVTGKAEILTIKFHQGANQIPRSLVINRISDAFIQQLDESIFEDETSKYLTHLLHIGNGDNKVITTWTGSLDSLILKTYEAIPTSIQPNQEVWISKLISNPIIETVKLISETEEVCNQLKGPNFSLFADNGIEYKIYDDLVASGSVTSTDLINEYATNLGINTKNLDIQYVSGSVYTFNNFINFSSAAERLNNFFYKIKLIEYYKSKYQGLAAETYVPTYDGYSGGVLTQDGYQTITEDGLFDIQWEIASYNGIAQQNEAKKVFASLNEVLRSFDGYENFLYKSTDVLAYPKTKYTHPITGLTTYILNSSEDSTVLNWYYSILDKSETYDKYNPNYLINNIPKHISENSTNEDFLTFLNMIGQHFDIIWSYINGLSRLKKLEASQTKGIANDLVKNMLESLGWDSKRAFNSEFLWEYAFGTYKDGFQKYSMPLKDANNEVWRRILNNLPYILKHKGTGRAMKAVMACYGVPQSMLTIMEFGGPQDPDKGGSTKFTFDDRTAAIHLQVSSSISVPWHEVDNTGLYPQSIEFRIKPDIVKNTRIISSSQFNLDIIQTTGSYVRLDFSLGDSSVLAGPYFEEPFLSGSPVVSTIYITPETSGVYALGPDTYTSSLDFPLSTENYSNILLNKYNYGSSTLYEVLLATSDGHRITTYASMSLLSAATPWESGSSLSVGNTFSGSLDEFRLWRVPLQPSKFQNHTLFPDAINGNSYTASTHDLLFRLDFEYPKDRTLDPNIKNVAISDIYAESFASASYIYSASTYPYQYISYDRTVTATVPSLGFGYGNKIRFEDQELVGDLSYKARATKKSFDRAPIDSNRLGLFFSPIKELNMDILKAFGDFNIDNYIGDPSDEYKDSYKELDVLREYYFERLDRNINEYIQLVRYIDKSLFEVLADLAPARAKVSKGLLIEPHYLERSKTKWKKLESERNDFDTSISINENNEINAESLAKDALLDAREAAIFDFEYDNLNGLVDAHDVYNLEGNNENYETEVDYNFYDLLEASAPFYNSEIQCPTGETLMAEIDSFKFEQIGMEKDSLSNLGFGLYAKNGVGIVHKYDEIFGNEHLTGSRQNIYLVKQQYVKNVPLQVSGYPVNGYQPGDQVKYENVPVTNYKYKVSIVPFSGSIADSSEIVEVKALNGYFPTHYKYKNNLSEGLKRSFWKGSKQGLDANGVLTTPDGLPAVETFTTNPNVLRVAKTGRGSGEPILIVD
jgi:hypothetical protein